MALIQYEFAKVDPPEAVTENADINLPARRPQSSTCRAVSERARRPKLVWRRGRFRGIGCGLRFRGIGWGNLRFRYVLVEYFDDQG